MKNKSQSGKTARTKANGDFTSAFTGAANSAMVKGKVKGARAVVKKTAGKAKEGGIPSDTTQTLRTFNAAAVRAMKKAGVKNPAYKSGDTRRNARDRK